MPGYGRLSIWMNKMLLLLLPLPPLLLLPLPPLLLL